MEFIDILNKCAYKVKQLVVKLAETVKKGGICSCLCVTTLLCLVPLIAAACILTFHISTPKFYYLRIQLHFDDLYNVNKKFLSLGLDSSVITDGFDHFDMNDPKLVKMMKYLSPAYLRIGGNQADQIIFCGEMNAENCTSKYENSIFNKSEIFTLSGSDWLKLHQLAKMANIDVIYDLNSLLRYDNGSWNSENAEEMIKFSEDHRLMLDWELGNEPNSYEYKFNTTVNPTQLGMDYLSLRNILNKTKLYNHSFLVGPSTTRFRTREIEEYLAEFLITGSKAVGAVTWHHYYFSGMNATSSEFLNPHVFDYLKYQISKVMFIVRKFLAIPSKPIWLGETSSAWHGGAPNLSDRFISSFIWIDKLGLSASMGIDLVVRQSIFKGHYALLNDSYYPNPDWWLSVLYKKLVDSTVIDTYGEDGSDENIRLYAHCATKSSLSNDDVKNSTYPLVVFGVNLNDKTGLVKIGDLRASPEVHVYEFTSESSLFSQYVRLNGQILNLLPNLELPELKPKIVSRNVPVFTMPPYSIVFWVFTNTNMGPCV